MSQEAKGILKPEKMTFWQLVKDKEIKSIRIPIIQRDYAQGRSDSSANSVREKFLEALHGAVKDRKPLLLDFIYGEEENGVFVPFDGQQRLTTLFLLHWYAAVREGKLNDPVEEGSTVRDCLKKFQYEVRYGARLFGRELVERACPPDRLTGNNTENPLSDYIMDQHWFRPNWIYDPTIMGMLTMLDAIREKFHDISELWETLTAKEDPPVSFFFEKISNLGSSAEELYIKINARGKQLTDFEEFKAQFLEYLPGKIASEEVQDIANKLDNQWLEAFWDLFGRSADVKGKANRCFSRCFADVKEVPAFLSDSLDKLYEFVQKSTDFEKFKAQVLEYLKVQDIAKKLDNQWLDVFWRLFGRNAEGDKAAETDCCFYNYFKYVSEMLSGSWKPANEGDLFGRVKSALEENPLCQEKSNLQFLIDFLDKLHERASKSKNGIDAFFDGYFTIKTSPNKEKDDEKKITLFDSSSTNLFTLCRKEPASLGRVERFMLAGCLLVLVRDLEHGAAVRRLRMLRNLLVNSSSELRSGNYAKQIQGVYALVVEERFDPESRFNTLQIEEEKAKEALRQDNPTDSELHSALDYLEDHPLLRGRLAVFRNPECEEEFQFNKDTILQGKHFFERAFGKERAFEKEEIEWWDTVVRGLLSQEDYAVTYRTSFLYLGSTTLDNRRRIFAPEGEVSSKVCKAVQSLAKETFDEEDLDSKINGIADEWARKQDEKKEMNWRYYFVQYPKMCPGETQGFYFPSWSPRKFEMVQLSKAIRSAPHWNPFLRAACVEAGLPDVEDQNDAVWVKRQDTEEKILLFKYSDFSLTLEGDEFSWHLRKLEGPDERFKELVDELNGICKPIWQKMMGASETADSKEITITNNGDLSIPGRDHIKDGKPEYREYDTVDRIQLITPVIKALRDEFLKEQRASAS